MIPGVTLADSTGARRIRKLEDARLDIQIRILQDLDKVNCIEHEIETISTQMRGE
jgi:hypothetical protein